MKVDHYYNQAVKIDLDAKIKKQVLYAAAFISPGILSTSYEDGKVGFCLDRTVPCEDLKAGLDMLIERFAKAQKFDSDVLFEREVTGKGRGITELQELVEAGIIQETSKGIFLWREPVSLFLRFLDDALVQRFAKSFHASEEKYPNVISAGELIKTNHLSSFPEHLNFVNNIRSELKLLDDAAEAARSPAGLQFISADIMENPKLIHNPSTCYHCYASRAGTTVKENKVVTALASCHRYEGANHQQIGRLMEFSLREVIFLGSPNFVRETREKCLRLIQIFADEWEFGGVLRSENDPFFTSDFETKAEHQRKMKMKYEYRASLCDDNEGLAVMSSNLHGLTFSKTFNLEGKDWPVHTGCIGFGLERMAIALIAQHGTNPDKWPQQLKVEWDTWCERR